MVHEHRPVYSPEELTRILHYNKYVQVYLWAAIVAFAIVLVLANALGQFLSYLRRTYAARFVNGGTRPSAACSRTGIGCTKWVPGTMLATLRKVTVRKSAVAEAVGMSSMGEIIVIESTGPSTSFSSLSEVRLPFRPSDLPLLTSPWPFHSAAGKIDYMAHHAARLVFANLPLVIGFASKNNVISYAVSHSSSVPNHSPHCSTDWFLLRESQRLSPLGSSTHVCLVCHSRRWKSLGRLPEC